MTAPTLQTTPLETKTAFSWLRSLRISSFQVGSAMGEILTASVWNRVMISDLGMPATPVAFLLALQYFLIPITLWAGHRSDTIPLWGKYRTHYIWLGRGTMVFAFPLLGFSIQQFESGNNSAGWLLATIAFLLFGGGKLMSGSIFLSLVRDSAPPSKTGIAIGLAETTLIMFFPVAAIVFGRWMETYDQATFWQMIMATAILGVFFWVFSIFGIEASNVQPKARPRFEFRKTLKRIWANTTTRAFFIFLATSKVFAWMQDTILEPFGRDVFGMEAGQTTRFTGYWAGPTVIILLACFYIFRKQRPENQTTISVIGLVWMGLGMGLLAIASFMGYERLLTTGLVNYGLGFGLYTFGGLSLMAAMSPTRDAGAYLGLWTACILLSKGSGTFFGGFLRDILYLQIEFSAELSYAVIFGVSGLGLWVAARLCQAVDVVGFARANE